MSQPRPSERGGDERGGPDDGTGAAGPRSDRAAAQHPTRSAAREVALAAMCHLEVNTPTSGGGAETLATFWTDAPRDEDTGAPTSARVGGRSVLEDGPVRAFATRLLETWIAQSADIDGSLQRASQRWRVERMDRIDRAILRLAVAEVWASAGVPDNVVIAEAVRLAARYGSERSAPFVNGLLSSWFAQRRAATEPAAPTPDSPQASPAQDPGGPAPAGMTARVSGDPP